VRIPRFRVVYAFNTGRSYTPQGQRIAFTAVVGGVYFVDIDRGIRGYYRCEANIGAFLYAYDAAGAELWRPAEYDPNQLEKEGWDAAQVEFRLLEKTLLKDAASLGAEDKPRQIKIVRLPGMTLRIPLTGLVYAAILQSEREEVDDDDLDYNTALDALESLVLAHASNGVKIEESRYVSGLITALEAIANNT
jgi:hypothetical protein